MADLPVPPASRSFKVDLLERVLWTAVQAALGVISVEALGVSVVYAPIVASALSVAKGYVARRLGNPQSAATLPWGV
jgi:hypothetical protein